LALLLGDIPLSLPTSEIRELIERDLNVERLQLAFGRSWPGFGQVGIAVPTMFRQWPPLKLNRFYWPRGASRWESGLFLCSKRVADAVHPAAFGSDGSQSVEQQLMMSKEDRYGNLIEKVTTNVTVFPPIPVKQVFNLDNSTTYGMYLVYLVGIRFYWWWIPTPDFSISETGNTTWDNVITSIYNAIDDDVDYSDIPAAYLKPSRALNLTNEPLPMVFDAVAENLGMKVCVDYTGHTSLQNASDGVSNADADQQNNPQRTIRAGGGRYVDVF
jgi:hypothetical protein